MLAVGPEWKKNSLITMTNHTPRNNWKSIIDTPSTYPL